MITYDKKSWKIDNKRTFILSAAIHYFRLPQAEWDEVLEKAKAGGCNTIETYVPWNFHEMNEGEWDFTGDKDLGHFLQLCADKGLYAIVRPGPYICAEWDFGGLPWWLTEKKDIQYRSCDPNFLQYVDKYFDQVIRIIDSYQLTKNGTVIMVQIENEFQAYGRPDKPYMEYLREGMKARGIEVPFVTCYGGVDGAVEFLNFWSHSHYAAATLDERFTDQPKGVMEFWIGWFEQWGGTKANQKTPEHLERECYQLLSNGFTAINYYMYFGGTNFDHWGGRTVGEQTLTTTSYDYDVALDEYVQPTRKYEVLKRFHSFVNWLEPIFTNAEQTSADIKLPDRLSARKVTSPAGEVLFIENSGDERAGAHIFYGHERIPFTVEANAILPIVRDVEVEDLFTIKVLTGQTTGFGSDQAVIYHETGQRSSLLIQTKQKAEIQCPLPNRYEVLEDGSISFQLFHSIKPQTVQLSFEDGSTFSIEVVSRILTEDSIPQLEQHSANYSLTWEAAEEDLSFISGNVKAADKPLDFTKFGQFSGYLGYESEFTVDEAGEKTIVFPRIEDPVMVFCNDQYAGKLSKLGAATIDVQVKQGTNKLTCLVQNMGRFNFTQAMGEPKGISEAPAIGGKYVSLRDNWQVEGCGAYHHLSKIPGIGGRIGFLKTFVNDGYDRAVLVGEGVSRVKVNGKSVEVLMECQTGWSRNSAVYGIADLSEVLQQGENVLDFDVQGISSIRRFDLYLFNEEEQILHWKMKSLARVEEAKEWRTLAQPSKSTVVPRWYKSHFNWSPDQGSIIKIRFDQMSKGCFWVNGFCLGRYWNVGPQEEYKIPASLLKHQNELIIFDEEGQVPDGISIQSFTPITNMEKSSM
ncbi:beta-galactosidase [Neobacillus kokaensis]|uniref:Beta-galactosidase n=1 Tax=Neobacillus kokaensis TaxID=2759023 RepID=A0ABQ3N5F6_9BACI|nr:beta-galactosidase [Neobacillus kokaensis]GHH99947.1 beta-galactosidase [Neobacillus kokaensis]